jgi:hypothetical protein
VAVSDTPPPSSCTEDCSRASAAQCYVGVCDEDAGACKIVPRPNGTPCDDGLFCTVGETCTDGACGNAKPNLCGASDCLNGVCNEAAKQCFVTAVADDTPCAVQSDPCTVGASCKSGECVALEKDCSDVPGIDECHVGTCDPTTGACRLAPGNDFAPCSALGTCSVMQWCWQGACQGGEHADQDDYSTDTTACHERVCNPKDGTFTPKTIPIGQACPFSSGSDIECWSGKCVTGGVCQPVIQVAAPCTSVADDCTVGTCNADGRCSPEPANEGAVCDDRDACTQASTCKMGACTGSVRSGVHVYFKDDFSGAFTWTPPAEAGVTWGTKPARSIYWQTPLVHEPEFDHTATMDQQMLVCEGCPAGNAVDGPAIDLSGATGSVWLTVWSSLTQGQITTCFISVFDGTKWEPVWATPFDDISTAWTWSPITVDVTKYKNKNFRIQFGITYGDPLVAGGPSPSWFIDDVTVASAPCAASPGDQGTGGSSGG